MVTTVTLAPRRTHSSEIAWPCLPDDRFAITRTASIGSRVPPAVTTTLRPSKSRSARDRSAAATMSAGSARRPLPISPPARRPASGSTICTPRERNNSIFASTAGCSHISVCIAGHTTTGARVAIKMFVRRSVDKPCAYAASTRAVAGATSTKSAP